MMLGLGSTMPSGLLVWDEGLLLTSEITGG